MSVEKWIPAAGYLRCSTDMQEDSVGQQKKAIEGWASKNGFKVIAWFTDEGQSGTSFSKRPGFTRMVQSVEQHPDFKFVLVYDESRWGRAGNPRENTYWKVHFERYGVRVRVINSGSRNENDIGSFVVEVVESAEASEYSKKLSRSTKRGCLSRANLGFSAGGSATYGYKRVAVDPQTGKEIRELPDGVHRRKDEEFVSLRPGDPFEVAIVRRIFEERARGVGYRSIADRLNKDGIPCPARGRWRNLDQKWSRGTIATILQNPMYYGARAYNRFPKNKLTGRPRGERNPLSEWVIKEGAHPAIISKSLFERANNVHVWTYASGAGPVVMSQYLLSGLIQCSRCGFNYNGFSRRKQQTRFYADSGFLAKGTSVCTWHAIPQIPLDQFVLDAITESLVESRIERRLEELIQAYFQDRGEDSGGPLGRLQASFRECEAKLKNMLAFVEAGGSLDTALPRIKEIEKERDWLTQELAKARRAMEDRRAVKDAAVEAARFILDFPRELKRAPLLEKKLLLRKVVEGILVDRDRDEVVLTMSRLPKIENPILKVVRDGVVRLSTCPEQDLNLQGLAATSS